MKSWVRGCWCCGNRFDPCLSRGQAVGWLKKVFLVATAYLSTVMPCQACCCQGGAKALAPLQNLNDPPEAGLAEPFQDSQTLENIRRIIQLQWMKSWVRDVHEVFEISNWDGWDNLFYRIRQAVATAKPGDAEQAGHPQALEKIWGSFTFFEWKPGFWIQGKTDWHILHRRGIGCSGLLQFLHLLICDTLPGLLLPGGCKSIGFRCCSAIGRFDCTTRGRIGGVTSRFSNLGKHP